MHCPNCQGTQIIKNGTIHTPVGAVFTSIGSWSTLTQLRRHVLAALPGA